MKKGILLLLLFASVFVQAQSLKDALFGGKLKNEPGTVIRKGDDLSSKMDTARKIAAVDTTKTKVILVTTDTSVKRPTTQTETVTTPGTDKKDSLAASTDANAITTNATAPKDNNAIWKEYMAGVINTLKTEVLPSKKVKKETYDVQVSYAIGPDGQVTVTDVFVSPENEFLQQQIKDRVSLETPHLNPVLSSSGTPRKVSKKYSFTLTKE